MKNYEIMFIIKPTLSDEDVTKTIESFGKILTDNEAKIVDKKDMGKRELAYEIKGCKSGHYYLYVIEAENDKAIKEFDRLSLISTDIVRHLITRLEK